MLAGAVEPVIPVEPETPVLPVLIVVPVAPAGDARVNMRAVRVTEIAAGSAPGSFDADEAPEP